jgi:hypothetical protein
VALVALGGLLAGCQNSADPAADAATATAAPATQASSGPADNGVAALTADQILDKAKGALKAAKSYHVSGTTTEDGEKTALDFEVSGDDLLGKLTVGKASVELLSVGGARYIRPNEAFWALSMGNAKQAKQVATVVGKKWVSTKSDKSLDQLFDGFDADSLLDPDGTLSKTAAKEIDGVPAIGLKDSTGGTLYVATVGEPYPLKIEDGDGGTFDKFGEKFTDIKAPAAAEVFAKAIG